MPHRPFRRRYHSGADIALTVLQDAYKGFAVQAERHRPPHIAVMEWLLGSVDQQIAAYVLRHQFADRLGCLRLDVFHQRGRQRIGLDHVDLPANERQNPRRAVLDGRILDTFEIRPVRLRAIRNCGPCRLVV